MKIKRGLTKLSLGLLITVSMMATAQESKPALKIFTQAPSGTKPCQGLSALVNEWKAKDFPYEPSTICNAAIKEATIVSQLQNRTLTQYGGAALSVVSLNSVSKIPLGLTLPGLIKNQQDFNQKLSLIKLSAEQELRNHNLEPLAWAYLGNIYFFVGDKYTNINDFLRIPLGFWSQDEQLMKIFTNVGFSHVRYTSNMLPHEINASIPALMIANFAGRTGNRTMIDYSLAAQVVVVVMKKDIWDKLGAPIQKQLIDSTRQAADDFSRNAVQSQIEEKRILRQKGVVFVSPTGDDKKAWDTKMEELRKAYCKERVVPQATCTRLGVN